MSHYLYEDIILQIIRTQPRDRAEFLRAKKNAAAGFHIPPPSNEKLIAAYRRLREAGALSPLPHLEQLLQKRSIRTASGIACITVMTKQYRCPGRCIFCPQAPGMPKSYLPDEPAMMRAVQNKFDPYKQVSARLSTLKNNGHPTDKIEIRIAGETWSAYPKAYQTRFVKRIFDALNRWTAPSLLHAQKRNEDTENRCIGMSIETRPDWITPAEIKRLRMLGITLVELGVQHTDNAVLAKNHRDHTIEDTMRATQMLRDAGFKIVYHTMPNLYSSTPEMDYAAHLRIFEDPNLRPDQLKIYPCILLKNTVLHRLYLQKKYTPYSTEELASLLLRIKKLVPEYSRIIRVIRDVPGHHIVAGNTTTNLRQLLYEHPDFSCSCIRCREPKQKTFNPSDVLLRIQRYEANGGEEYFISFESKDRKTLFAFVRLRLPNKQSNTAIFPELNNAALIRELHVYGMMVPLEETRSQYPQHHGLGTALMKQAEKCAFEHGFRKMAVISGIGVRAYYREKLGYHLSGTYMTKNLYG